MARAKLVAGGLTLRNQINKRWPSRDKRSDGWLGDSAHQARVSDHNPDKQGWVHAIDIDHNMGPAGPARQGETAEELANQLIKLAREGKDNGRLKYVVYNNRIASGTHKNEFWTWRKGNWGHTQHIHVSFTSKAQNDGSPFPLEIFNQGQPPKPEPVPVPPKPAPAPPKPPVSKAPKFPGSDNLSFGKKNNHVKMLQEQLIRKGYRIPAGATGTYGQQTANAVKKYYIDQKWLVGTIAQNGKKVGPKGWERLFS
jgi:hypothetical protein